MREPLADEIQDPSRSPTTAREGIVRDPPQRSTPNAQGSTLNAPPGVTLRAVLVALALMPINAFWIMQMELIRYSGHPTTISVFFNVVFILILLTILNQGIKRFRPALAFRQGEMLTLYVMLSIASALCGHDFLEILVSYIGHAYRYARPENRWAELLHPFLPSSLVMSDERTLEGLYLGQTTLYDRHFLLSWMTPVLMWTAFVSLLVFMMLCINVIVRKRWTEEERLTYPLVLLPLEMTDERLSLYRSRLFWIGFALAGGIDLMSGLHFWYPSIPAFTVRVTDLSGTFTDKPWTAARPFNLSFYPFVIGLGILLPVDLLFSSWFFFFFWKAQRVISSAMAWDTTPNFPYINEQSFAGYIGLSVFAIWTGRRYFAGTIRRALGRKPTPDGYVEDDAREPWSYRTAYLGLILGTAALMAFCVTMGMSLWVAAVFFFIYFLLSLAVTRIRAELGPPAHDLHNGGPDVFLVNAVGAKNLGPNNLAMFSLFFFFNRAYRAHPMPFQLEGFKMAERTRMNARRLSWAMMAAAAWGTVCAFWAFLHIGYDLGIGTAKVVGPVTWAFGTEPWNRMQSWMNNPEPTSVPRVMAMGVGFAFTVMLMALRMRFYWWPFHPVGYAVSSSWSLNIIWLPLFIAWAVKLLLLRYGGLKLYRDSLPFFLGLILGEFVVGSLWTIIGIVMGIPSYGFWV
ncbi:MAG: hypothetical protein KY468_14155 [Armatimonadetes bacterium]|nr:hypothetical protein [Armatimonadota bacterium]